MASLTSFYLDCGTSHFIGFDRTKNLSPNSAMTNDGSTFPRLILRHSIGFDGNLRTRRRGSEKAVSGFSLIDIEFLFEALNLFELTVNNALFLKTTLAGIRANASKFY
jgi:hypothetical protein